MRQPCPLAPGAALSELFTSTPAPALALLSMVAYFTGVVRSPITAVVVVVEMTNDHAMLLPLMGTALIAEWVSRHVCSEPLYKILSHSYLEKSAEQDGSGKRQRTTG